MRISILTFQIFFLYLTVYEYFSKYITKKIFKYYCNLSLTIFQYIISILAYLNNITRNFVIIILTLKKKNSIFFLYKSNYKFSFLS